MTQKQTQTVANRIIDSIEGDLETVATIGYKGELPEGLDADERFELLNAIQDTAKCIVAGACRR